MKDMCWLRCILQGVNKTILSCVNELVIMIFNYCKCKNKALLKMYCKICQLAIKRNISLISYYASVIKQSNDDTEFIHSKCSS